MTYYVSSGTLNPTHSPLIIQATEKKPTTYTNARRAANQHNGSFQLAARLLSDVSQ